jgi:hypothetical protein
MKKARLCVIFFVMSLVLGFAGCPLEGNTAIFTIKNQSSLAITGIKVWRGTEALEDAKAKMADAELDLLCEPSVETALAFSVAVTKYEKEVEKTCARSPEIADKTGIAVHEIKSWELNSGSILVRADCGGRDSSPYVVNFGGDHAVRFIGQNISDENGDDWE